MDPSRSELELGQFIPLQYHFNMLDDARRTGAFEEAIGRVVSPGARVVELGGGTGVLSFFAARNASRVWCVERNLELSRIARRLIALNGVEETVDVVDSDAFAYLPPEPVDVAICEMLHVTMLVEKQFPVIASFKARYLDAFGPPLPRLVPEGLVQAVQPVQQSFDYHGYNAPAVLFQDPGVAQPRTRELGEPVVYQSLLYEDELPRTIAWTGRLAIARPGHLNAVRFVTKNLLAVLPEEGRSVDWLMSYLIVPLEGELTVGEGESIELSFAYEPGERLAALKPVARIV